MKQVILVRHGKAEEQTNGQSDFDRELKKRGLTDAKIIAEAILRNGVSPDVFISSDAVRAFQTATIFAETFKFAVNDIQKERFIYEGYTTGQMVSFLNEIDDSKKCVIIFGHNPCISQSGIRLSKNFHQSFPTAACLCLSFDTNIWDIEPETGEICFFEFPKKYR